MPIFYDLNTALSQHFSSREWAVRIENTTAGHFKFWQAENKPLLGQVHITYGKIGGTAQGPLVKDWAYVETNLQKKLKEGYKYVSSTQRIAQPTQAPVQAPAPPVQAAPAPVAPAAPAVPNRSGPFALIRKLVPVMENRVLVSWVALDVAGKQVVILTPEGGRDLARKFPDEITIEAVRL